MFVLLLIPPPPAFTLNSAATHRATRHEQTALLRLVEDVLHDPVFHGETGVEELALSQHSDLRRRSKESAVIDLPLEL